ncbi:hypothetical protein EIP86_006310 [Pleurotus ostreatoroseus]|nr:hypothetical protein EIP86_006310 [Pleurotus ostreatoroseus]
MSHRRTDSGVSGVVPALNLKPLQAIAIYRWLDDPSRFLCQYEVPGGGECRDSHCEDIHPSRAGAVEPTDEDTARYLREVLPESAHLDEKALLTALQVVRLRHADASLAARVSDALGALGLQAVP